MKIKLAIIFLFFSVKLCAQSPFYDSTKALQPVSAYGSDNKNGKFRGALNIPLDTIKMAVKDSGAIVFKSGSIWSWSGYKWVSGGSGGSGVNQNLQQVTNIDSTTTKKITARTFAGTNVPTYSSNADAIAASLQDGDIYKLPISGGNYLLAIVSIISNALLSQSGLPILTSNNTPILTN